MSTTSINDLLQFLARLRKAKIHYSLSDPTEGAVMVEIAVPGERWEIEFHMDGEIGVEVFRSADGVKGPELVEVLFDRFGDS